jgi:hypothetical protein
MVDGAAIFDRASNLSSPRWPTEGVECHANAPGNYVPVNLTMTIPP